MGVVFYGSTYHVRWLMVSLSELLVKEDCWLPFFEFIYPDFTDINVGSTEATLAVKKECIKKSSSCSFGQITS